MKRFEKPELEIVFFENTEVISTSSCGMDCPGGYCVGVCRGKCEEVVS